MDRILRPEDLKESSWDFDQFLIHPVLAIALTALPFTFTNLETAQNKARSCNGLGTSMPKWCDMAGLPWPDCVVLISWFAQSDLLPHCKGKWHTSLNHGYKRSRYFGDGAKILRDV